MESRGANLRRAYELASACKAHGSSVLLFSSAWTDSHPDDDPKTVPPVNCIEILTYWLSRLEPLVGSDVHFVCANRVVRGGSNGKSTHRGLEETA